MTEHSELFGGSRLLFPLGKKDDEGFLAHPHLQPLSMKGYSNDGNQGAALCSMSFAKGFFNRLLC